MSFISGILKKSVKVAAAKPQVIQQNQALLKQQLKSLDTFVSSQAPAIKTSETQAFEKLTELAKTVSQNALKK